jgi:hypothetical protein
MKFGDRVPGATLSRRSSGRLARADRHLRGPRLIARLTRRASAGPALLSGTLRRMERWQRSPMLAWARAVDQAPPRWGLVSPELVLAWPQAEPAEPAEPGVVRARARAPRQASARAAALPPVGAQPQVVPSLGGIPRARPEAPPPPIGAMLSTPDGRPARPMDPRIVGPVGPSLHPGLPFGQAQLPLLARAPLAAHPVLARAESRQRHQPRLRSPASSHWVSRLLAPPPTQERPAAAPAARLERPGRRPSGAPEASARVPRFAPAAPAAVLAQLEPQPSSERAPSSGAPAPHAPSAGRGPALQPAREARPSATARAGGPAVLRGLRERTQIPSVDELQAQGRSPQAAHRAVPSALPEPAPAARIAQQLERHPSRSLLTALARASSAEGVARVAVAHAPEIAQLKGLPTPLAEVVGALSQQANQVRRASQGAPDQPRPSSRAAAAPSAPQQRAQRQIEQVLRSQADSPVVSLSSQRLLRRLQNLVHLAEVDRRRLEAQRKVRMAEDTAHARAQAQATPGSDAAGDAQPVDLDALQREVFNVVNALHESRTVRRLEDPDVPHDAF